MGGALRASLEAMFKAITGKELKTVAFGKPQLGTFEFATRLLQQWRKDTHGINKPPEFNEHGSPDVDWYSILVRTGVFREGTRPAFMPRMTVDNVLEAVKHGMQREFDKALKNLTIGGGAPQL